MLRNQLVISPRMQMNGVDCCQLWQWTSLTDCCRNCLVALQTQWQQSESIVFYLDLVEHHLLSLNSLASVSVLRCWGNFPNFSRDNESRPSSCRSIIVNGQETPIHHCKNSVKELVNQYLLEFPNGVNRTYNYTHMPPNFCYNTMLAGLCNWRDELGHSNYDNFTSFLEGIHKSSAIPVAEMKSKVLKHQSFMKIKFSN